jgi:hypothetical protein
LKTLRFGDPWLGVGVLAILLVSVDWAAGVDLNNRRLWLSITLAT